jgi:hypothetical protein
LAPPCSTCAFLCHNPEIGHTKPPFLVSFNSELLVQTLAMSSATPYRSGGDGKLPPATVAIDTESGRHKLAKAVCPVHSARLAHALKHLLICICVCSHLIQRGCGANPWLLSSHVRRVTGHVTQLHAPTPAPAPALPRWAEQPHPGTLRE